MGVVLTESSFFRVGRSRRRWRFAARAPRGLALFALFALMVAPTAAWADDPEAWQALREGRALLMVRHALAPGVGDPPEFDINDCSTQRNLNNRGQSQARAWGQLLTERGIERARLYTSQWCRCRDTATGMGLGEVTEWPALNSFFRNPGDGPRQTRETIELVNGLEPGLPVVLVSHQVNITRLADVFPRSNEGIILALPLTDSPAVLGRVIPPE